MGGGAKLRYIPRVGDSVVARRKVKTSNLPSIIGPVVQVAPEVNPQYCLIITNRDTEHIEGHFWLSYKDWTFQFLYKTNVEEVLS